MPFSPSWPNIINYAIDTLIKEFCADPNIIAQDVNFVAAYPGVLQDMPITKTTVSVGFKDFISDHLNPITNQVLPIPGIISFVLTICMPKNTSAAKMNDIFELIMSIIKKPDVLVFSIKSITTREIYYNRTIGGVVLPIDIAATTTY